MKKQCMQVWNLHREVTVDETMVAYKSKYCGVRQYITFEKLDRNATSKVAM